MAVYTRCIVYANCSHCFHYCTAHVNIPCSLGTISLLLIFQHMRPSIRDEMKEMDYKTILLLINAQHNAQR